MTKTKVHFPNEKYASLDVFLNDGYFKAGHPRGIASYHIPNFLEHRIVYALISKPYTKGYDHPSLTFDSKLIKGNLIITAGIEMGFYESEKNPIPRSPVPFDTAPINRESWEKSKTICDVIKATCEKEKFKTLVKKSDGVIGYNLHVFRTELGLEYNIYMSSVRNGYSIGIWWKIIEINILPKHTFVCPGLSEND